MIGYANGHSRGRSIIEVPSALRRALNARTARQRDSSHAELMALLEYEVVNEQRGATPFRDAIVALRAVDNAHWSTSSINGRLRCSRVWALIYGPKIGAMIFLSALIAGIVSGLQTSYPAPSSQPSTPDQPPPPPPPFLPSGRSSTLCCTLHTLFITPLVRWIALAIFVPPVGIVLGANLLIMGLSGSIAMSGRG